MSEANSNFPFYSWVPRPLGILVLLLMFVPPTFSGGAYLCNVSEMSSSLALWTEDVQMASFFTSIGMCLFPPFMVRFLQARRVKQTYLWGFFLLILLNGMCALTTSRIILFAACFFIGVFAAAPSSHLATASLKGRVTKQATLVAMKNITGDTVILLSATAFLVLLLPYRKGETT